MKKNKEDRALYAMWTVFKLCFKLLLIPVLLVLIFYVW